MYCPYKNGNKKDKVEIFGISQHGTQDTGEHGQDHAHHTAGPGHDSEATPRGCLRAEPLYFNRIQGILPGQLGTSSGMVSVQGSTAGLRAPPRGFRCPCKTERFGPGISEPPPTSSASWWGLWGTSTGVKGREPLGAPTRPGVKQDWRGEAEHRNSDQF